MHKKLASSLLVLFMVVALAPAARAEEPVKLWINGDYVNTDVPPQIENGRTLVPIRVVSETLGLKIAWDGENRTVVIGENYDPQTPAPVTPADAPVKLWIKGDFVNTDVPPKIENGRTLVPIRVISETLGLKVEWDGEKRTVVIGEGYNPKPPAPTPAPVVKPETILNVGDEWVVPHQWKLKLESVKATDYRNDFFDKPHPQVIVVTYSFENLGHKGAMHDLVIYTDEAIDEQGAPGLSYSADLMMPQETPIGEKCVDAQGAFGLSHVSNHVIVTFSEYDDNGTLHRVGFKAPVTK